MGGCNETQLDQLPKHAVGIPSKFEWHPFCFIDFKEQTRVRKQAAGKDPFKVAMRGQRFHMNYGFIRASNDNFSRPNIKKDQVVESFDGYTSYLLVVDEVSKVFGSRVCVKVTGKRRSKLDRHTTSREFSLDTQQRMKTFDTLT
jgi:hypothetical protein